jgi:hypothetical protein
VVLGEQILSDGKSLTAGGLGTAFDGQLGLRRATADHDGRFRIRGIPAAARTVVAEHAERGRSRAAAVPAGDEDVLLELALLAPGAIAGKVTRNGAPAGDVAVLVGPRTGEGQITMTQTGDDGAFAIERIAPGAYKVTAMIGSGATAAMSARPVEVAPGARAEVALDIQQGEIVLQIQVRGQEGAAIDSAQVFLFGGEVTATTGRQVSEAFLHNADTGSARMVFATAGNPARFDEVAPGAYSVCTIPIAGDLNDPVFAQRLQRHADQLAVYCQPVQVAASPREQTIPVVVPPMAPLPE